MARFGPAAAQYFDNNGEPLSGGKLTFYESGSTTPRVTYSDAGETIPNTNPVILDAGGRQPDIFFSGSAKVVLSTRHDVQIDVIDPVGGVLGRDAFAPWNALITYDGEDIVQGSDSKYYKSIASDNLGNDPVTTTGKWMEVKHVAIWDATYQFDGGDLATGPDGALYRCTVPSSQGSDPTLELEWTKIGASGWSSLVEDLTPTLGGNLDTNGNKVGDATSADLTKLSNVTVSAGDINQLIGASGNIQTQIDAKASTSALNKKADKASPQFSGVVGLTTNWSVDQSGETLRFRYNGVVKAQLTSAGLFAAVGDIKKGNP